MANAPRRTPHRARCEQSKDLPVQATEHDATPNRDKWWPACPDENPQRLLTIIGYRIKGPDVIQVLVLLTDQDNGVCRAPFAEHRDRVEVRAIACCDSKLGYDTIEDPRTRAWPANLWLASRLGDRIVVDVDTGRHLTPYILGRPNGSADSFPLIFPGLGEFAWIPDDSNGARRIDRHDQTH